MKLLTVCHSGVNDVRIQFRFCMHRRSGQAADHMELALRFEGHRQHSDSDSDSNCALMLYCCFGNSLLDKQARKFLREFAV